jgi:aspartyl protease
MMPVYDATSFNPPAPLAKVTLRNSENENTLSDVPFLIDSGADVTLIPESSVNQLGVHIDPAEAYELMSFDGSLSLAQAVQLDLIFLRRVFKGRFLIINQDRGILGRDILNHLSLLLDGPHLSWNEQ